MPRAQNHPNDKPSRPATEVARRKLLGAGTAMVNPTLLAAIGTVAVLTFVSRGRRLAHARNARLGPKS